MIPFFPASQQTQGPRGAGQVVSGAPGKPPRPFPISQPNEVVQPSQQKPKVPALEKHLVDQLSQEEQDALTSKFQEATDAEKKVKLNCSFNCYFCPHSLSVLPLLSSFSMIIQI